MTPEFYSELKKKTFTCVVANGERKTCVRDGRGKPTAASGCAMARGLVTDSPTRPGESGRARPKLIIFSGTSCDEMRRRLSLSVTPHSSVRVGSLGAINLNYKV